MCCFGYMIGQMAAGLKPQSGYGVKTKPAVVEPEPKSKPKLEPEIKPGVSSGAVQGFGAGFGFGVCQLAGCIAILLVICGCFGGLVKV